MRKFLARLKILAQTVVLNAVAMLRTMLVTEPARVRAGVLAGVVALAVFVPALADANVAGQVTGVVIFVLQLVVGEQIRARVTPVDKD
ncbi:hypothetical protein [Kitasatospora sp. NPDC101183]|uniref:hypothetical protein n=1 Tax=Kitasatospora sp. NPDC101183 TaxID=3364100 RepID=UPI00382A7FBF